MSIPGIDSILYTSGEQVWPGEREPSGDLVELINAMNGVIALDYAFDLAPEVEAMARMELEPSQEMRLRYFHGYLMRDNSVGRSFSQAAQFFEQALDIAETHRDLDSQIVLTDQIALMAYGQGFNRDAMYQYQHALDLWQIRARRMDHPPAEPDVHFNTWLGTTHFEIGEIEAAAGALARALTIVNQRTDIQESAFLQETGAKALWTLGLVQRAQSDMEDGSESLLLSAIQHLKDAISLFNRNGAHEYDIARIHIQVAETLLDLSDVYLQDQQDARAKDARAKALRYITTARGVQHFAQSDDVSGRALADLTLLRHQITRLPDTEAIVEIADFDERLTAITREAEAKSLPVIISKAMALRGEWLLWLGDAPHAREAFVLALEGFQADSTGEATRVHRLLRRSNNEGRAQRVRRPRIAGPRVSHSRKRT